MLLISSTGTTTISETDPQKIYSTASSHTIRLPSNPRVGHTYTIGSDNGLIIQNSTPTTIATLVALEEIEVYHTGSDAWRIRSKIIRESTNAYRIPSLRLGTTQTVSSIGTSFAVTPSDNNLVTEKAISDRNGTYVIGKVSEEVIIDKTSISTATSLINITIGAGVWMVCYNLYTNISNVTGSTSRAHISYIASSGSGETKIEESDYHRIALNLSGTNLLSVTHMTSFSLVVERAIATNLHLRVYREVNTTVLPGTNMYAIKIR